MARALSHTQSKYKILYQRIAKAIQDGCFYRYTKQKQRRLLQRLQRYYQQLVRRGQWMVPAASLVFGGVSLSHAQTFTQVTTTASPFVNVNLDPDAPFGLNNVGSFSAPSFVDVDGDGDFDAFVGAQNGNIIYFQNTGFSSSAAFAAPSTNPFGLSDVGNNSAPSFVDIDGDGDFDALVGEGFGNILYFQNTGTSSSAAFAAPSPNPFGLSDVGFNSTPSFVDIDGDGDFDALVGENYGNILYFQNTGTTASPAFATPSTAPFGLSDVGFSAAPSFVDIDGDGDFDALVWERFGNIIYFQNTGSSSSGAFASPSTNPFGLSDVGSFPKPSFVDIDNDGDFDAFVGERYGNIRFFQNTGSSSSAAFIPTIVDVGYYSAPSFADINGDGDLDTFVGERFGNIIYFQNTGSSSSAAFASPITNPFGLSDVGDFSAPSFVDMDGDGDLDAFVGERYGNILYFENTGSSSSVAFAAPITDPFGLSDVGYNSVPSFVDIDGDGDFDALVGDDYGNILYFKNTGSSSSGAFASPITNPFGLSGVGVGNLPKPSFVDIDGDGDFDALVGERFGNILYFQNTGSSSSAAFASPITNPFGLSDVGYNSAPSFMDIDGDTFFEAIIGNRDGRLIFFESNMLVPVELVYFKGQVQDQQVLLQWQTASELNNEGFEVQRSSNAKDWKSIGFVKGNGTTVESQEYSFWDNNPVSVIQYYRLKQLDFDGQFEYSDIIVINGELRMENGELVVFPNPVQERLTIVNGQGAATLYNAFGQVMQQFQVANAQFEIEVSGLQHGVYTLQVRRADGTVAVMQVVK